MAQTNVQAFSGDVEISGDTVLGNATYRKKRRWDRNGLAYVYLGNIQTNTTTGIRLDVSLNNSNSGYEMYQFQITLNGNDDNHTGGKMIYSALGGDVGSANKGVEIGYVYVGDGGPREYQLWLKDPTTDNTGAMDAYLNCQGYYNFDTGVSDVAQGGAAPTNFNLGTPGVAVDKFGNVGIGTNEPSAKLQVGGNAETSPQYLWIRGNRVNEAGEIAGIHFYNSLNSGDRGNSRIISSRGTNNYGSNLEFWTNPDDNVPALERMRIRADGNVGIGTNNPLFKLDIGSNTSRISGVSNYVTTASSVGTSTYVYIGRFTTYGTASVSFTTTGNSAFSANYATFIRHYDQIPTVSYLLQGDIYTTHQFYYQIVDVYAYDVWHRQTNLSGLTCSYYVSGAGVSLSGEPAVTNRLQFPYGYIATQGASAGISKHGFTGSVGVGKTNPGSKLDINAGSSYVNIQGPNQGNSGGPNNDPWTGLSFTRIGTSGETYNGHVNLRSYRWKTSGADPAMALTFQLSSTQPYNTSDIMTLRSDNKVGIGTTNPNTTLEVVGNINCSSIRLGTGNQSQHQKKVGVNNGNISFTFPLRLICNWSPGIVKVKAAMNEGNGGNQYAWHWTFSFRALDCGTPGYDVLTTIEGSNPGATFFEHSMNSNGQLTLTALAGGRDNVVAECEVIHYQGIYNN